MRGMFESALILSLIFCLVGCVKDDDPKPEPSLIQERHEVCPSDLTHSERISTDGGHSLWRVPSPQGSDAVYYVSYVTDDCIVAFKHTEGLFAPTPYFFHVAQIIVPDNSFTLEGIAFRNFITSAQLGKQLTLRRLQDCKTVIDPSACLAQIHEDNLHRSISVAFRQTEDSNSPAQEFNIDFVKGKSYRLGVEIND